MQVDDIGVKYTTKKEAEHLMNVLKNHYTTTEDCKGEHCAGMYMRWDYNGNNGSHGNVWISMSKKQSRNFTQGSQENYKTYHTSAHQHNMV